MNPPRPPLQWRIILSPLLLLSLLPHPSHALTADGLLLQSFKSALSDDPLSDWRFSDATPCSWRGVSCSPDFRVTALSLPNSHLHGPLSPHLGSLTHLQTLNLSSNFFNSSIPVQLFRATQLRSLDLSGNLITGELPEEIGQLQSLQLLNLSGNKLSGPFPGHLTGIGSLTVISLRNNGFSGGIPCGLDRVRVLDLSSNSMNGSLPDVFGGKRIRYLNISHNRISGGIPAGFGRDMTEKVTIDFSYNNLSGMVPNSGLFLNQKTASFWGNPGLCGGPLLNQCPATAATPTRNVTAEPAEGASVTPPAPARKERKSGMKARTIAVIVAGDFAGIGILAVVLLLVHRKRSTKGTLNPSAVSSNSPSTSTSSETKGFARWSCLGKTTGGDEDTSSSSETESTGFEPQDSQNAAFNSQECRNEATLVTLDGESQLDVETLLKASAYILGASGPTIVYKAVLEDGSALAVRRVGEGAPAAERLKDFESQVRLVAKVSAAHPNLVHIRGFYWGHHEKLIIYEFVPNGSLANARYRRGTGALTSACQLSWESRLKIAKGVARALAYLHDKRHVHGNLKPTNILLQPDSDPKVADFGLDRLSPGSQRPGVSTRHFGSNRSTASRESFQLDLTSPSPSSVGCVSPYHPPESLRSLRATPKWDVYAFGVVLLELLTGKVLGPEDAATWTAGTAGEKEEDKARVLRMADVAIRGDVEGREDVLVTCLRLGSACVATMPHKRPSMKEALQILDS